jgi:hypothetical protein
MTAPHKRNRPVVVATLDPDMIVYLNDEAKRRRTSVSAIIREALMPLMQADLARTPAPFASRPDDIEAMASRIRRQALAALAKADKVPRRVVAVPVPGNETARKGR